MSNFAILITGEPERVQAVSLVTGAELELLAANGTVEKIPWWKLYRIREISTTHHFRRLDRRQWELRVTAGADRELLERVGRRPLHRLIHPFRRLESLKVLVGVVVLLMTVAQHAPPEWLARYVPEWAQHRLTDGIVAQIAPMRCSHEGGEAVLRKLLMRLDPNFGPTTEIVAVNGGGFVVTATPGRKIFLYRSAMTEIDSAALPALLAHELSHIRHGDPMAAEIRHNGFLSTWAAILEGSGSRMMLMDFSGLEERRADLEAMQMMRRARIPLGPAAKMFEDMRVSKAQGGFYGYDLRDFHFGIDSRAQRWAAASRSDPSSSPALLTDREADDLYNFCWTGPIKALPNNQRRAPDIPAPPGSGGVAPMSANAAHG